jgi:hypothetical protein
MTVPIEVGISAARTAGRADYGPKGPFENCPVIPGEGRG